MYHQTPSRRFPFNLTVREDSVSPSLTYDFSLNRFIFEWDSFERPGGTLDHKLIVLVPWCSMFSIVLSARSLSSTFPFHNTRLSWWSTRFFRCSPPTTRIERCSSSRITFLVLSHVLTSTWYLSYLWPWPYSSPIYPWRLWCQMDPLVYNIVCISFEINNPRCINPQSLQKRRRI